MPPVNDLASTGSSRVFEQLGLIGCGLMGGSFALALKRAGLVKRVVGYSILPSSLELASKMGVIDAAAPSAQQAASGADLVLLAIPVSATEATLAEIRPFLQPGALLMDLGSTKGDVVQAAQRALGKEVGRFVPAHPIAGKEVAGVEHADASLFANCQVILTPTPQTLPTQLQAATSLWQALGCQVRQMSCESHDAAYAAVSHLPHLIAFAMMNAITSQPLGQDFLALAGTGFRDPTRIAASNPAIWRDILLANQQELLAQCKIFSQQLEVFEAAISSGDGAALEALIRKASQARAQWAAKQSPK